MKKCFHPEIFFVLFFITACKIGQPPPSSADYSRAESFTHDSLREKVYRLSVDPHWFADSSGFAYHVHTRRGEQYYTVSFAGLKKQPAFHTKRLADSLSALLGSGVDSNRLSMRNLHWQNKDHFSFSYADKRYAISLKHYHIKQIKNNFTRYESNEAISPNRHYAVYLKNNNLYLKNFENNAVVPLSSDGSKLYIYGSDYGWSDVMKGEDAGPAPHLTAQWSPDSRKILTRIMDARRGEKMYLLNWSIDSLYRPVLLSYYRSSPGDSNDVKYMPVIFDVHAHKMIRVDLPPIPHYLGIHLRWTKNGHHLYGLYYHRGYKKMDVIEVNPESGKVRTVFTDSAKTYIEYKTQFHYFERKGFAFITSERSGWNQLYRLDWKTGTLYPVTRGHYVVQDILAIDTSRQTIYFTASGKDKKCNPYYKFLYKIHFDGSGLTLLTPDPANHEVVLSPDRSYFVDNSSTPDRPTISSLGSTENGSILMRIDSADVKDLQATGWQPPQIFTTKARDGKTIIYGALWRPTNFNPHHHYPLIDYSYTGPQASVFPNTFSKAVYSFYSSAQSLAELGFIVMQLDGLGSAGRSKSFHDWSYKNMGNNLADHVLAISQLGKKYAWIDTTRVGIYGHSAGGYDAAHALMAFNHCYKAAIAESGDHDWRMEKAWWPEMYVGWPIDSNYQKQSNITMAAKLKGKLLLIHGGIDENVNPSATFKLSEALIKANRYFDLLIIPSSHHGYPMNYQDYIRKKRWDFFVQNLIINPPQ